jgi:hypothetical protein
MGQRLRIAGLTVSRDGVLDGNFANSAYAGRDNGNPADIASRIAMGRPSVREDNTKTSNSLRNSATLSLAPWKNTSFPGLPTNSGGIAF